MLASAQSIEQSVHKTNDWLVELSTNAGLQDKDDALESLRAVLHSLRDRLPIDSAASLAAQLPLVVKGIFYEEWDPSRTPEKIRQVDAFIDKVKAEMGPGNEALQERAREIICATFELLNHRLNHDTIEKFRQAFPLELRELWPEQETEH